MFRLIKKHFRNNNLIDFYHEFYYREQRTNFYQSQYINMSVPGIVDTTYTQHELVVSLTTFSHRIYDVHLTITSLMYQTLRANKIILWLAKDEFTENNIPFTLRKLVSFGLEIRFCDDIRSYKKIIPTLELYPDADIITVDDDVLYPPYFLEKMINAHIANPDKVCFNRGCTITLDENGRPLPYVRWRKASNLTQRENLPTGIGGILYPAGCFHADVIKKDSFMKLCPKADDLWLRVMCMINDTETYLVRNYTPGEFMHDFIEIKGSQKDALHSTNTISGVMNNDSQFEALFKYYNLANYIVQ